MASAASVVRAARQQVQGEWSEWSPLWRRPSKGPGSRSQSAEPPLAPLAPLALAPLGSSDSRRERLLKHRSRSLSSESDPNGPDADPADLDELVKVEQELEDKRRQLHEVRASGRALEEQLEARERDALHFSETVLALEAGLHDAAEEQGAPHRELRRTSGMRTQPLGELVDEWTRVRAAIGFD